MVDFRFVNLKVDNVLAYVTQIVLRFMQSPYKLLSLILGQLIQL